MDVILPLGSCKSGRLIARASCLAYEQPSIACLQDAVQRLNPSLTLIRVQISLIRRY